MRILHVLDHSLPLHSGYTFRSAALLRGQRELGWETHHITSPKQGKVAGLVDDVGDLRFFRTPPASGQLAQLPVLREFSLMKALERRLEAVCREIRPDILHAHSPVLNAWPALRVGRRLGIPVVYEIRAFWEDAAVDHGSTTEGSVRYRLTRQLETQAIRRAAHVFTICEGLRADIVARGIAAQRVSVVPNAVDVEAFQWMPAPSPGLRERYGMAGKTVLGFVGSFYAYEGLDLLVQAFASLSAQRSDLMLLLVGGGPQEQALKAQVAQLGLLDKVVFSGRVPHDEVSGHYALIDILAYPRRSMRLTELVTPLKPLEAMAQGKIFVASDVGGHKELIDDGRTGTLFKADDEAALVAAVSGLLDRPQAWDALRANGRRHVESVRNWRNSVAVYVDAYERVLAS